MKARGLAIPPKLAVGDGALGFWKALEEEFGATRRQRCWVHKTLSERLPLRDTNFVRSEINVRLMNVLNKLPKSIPSKAKADPRLRGDKPQGNLDG